MELRRDPISGNWVIQEDGAGVWPANGTCPFCPGQEKLSPLTIYSYGNGNGSWQVRVTPHLRPLYRIEEEPQRRAEGMYDKMRGLGAHEVVVETPNHQTSLAHLSDEGVAQVLRAYVSRISDLKKDPRFRYVTVFRDQGTSAGQDLEHPIHRLRPHRSSPGGWSTSCDPTSSITHSKNGVSSAIWLPRKLADGVRTVEWDDQFIAFCPFASRTPYETWILPTNHHSTFEEDLSTWNRQLQFARFLKSILRRLESVAAFVSFGPSHDAEPEWQVRQQTPLEDPGGGLPLALRDPAGQRAQIHFLQPQGGVLQLSPPGTSGGGIAQCLCGARVAAAYAPWAWGFKKDFTTRKSTLYHYQPRGSGTIILTMGIENVRLTLKLVCRPSLLALMLCTAPHLARAQAPKPRHGRSRVPRRTSR